MFCENCGKYIDEEARFCPYCGNHVGSDPLETDPDQDIIVEYYPPVPVKKKKPILALAFAAIILIAALAAGGFFLLRGGKQTVYLLASETRTIDDGDSGTILYTYDKKNRTLTGTYTDNDGETVEAYTYVYNAYGQIESRTAFDNAVIDKYSYDADGNMESHIAVCNLALNYERRYFYDETGELVKEIHNNDSLYGDGYYTYSYTRNALGQIIKCTSTSDGGSERVFSDYAYDADGNMIQGMYAENGKMYLEEYTYDDNGNVLTVSNSDYNVGNSSMQEFYYDSENRVQTEKNYVYINNELFSYIEKNFDKKGNLISYLEQVHGETDYQNYYEYEYQEITFRAYK